MQLLLMCDLAFHSQALITGTLNMSPSIISTKSTYQLELYLSTDIPSGGSIIVSFPTGFDLSASSSLSCTPIYGFSGSSATCTRPSTTTIKMTSSFPNNDRFIIFSINNIINPSYVSTLYVVITSYDSSSNQLETSGSNSIKLVPTPGTLSLSLSNLTQAIVGQYSNIAVKITVQSIVASSGYFEIYFPKWNSGTQTTNLAVSMIKYSSSDYSIANGGYLIDCSSKTNANMKCVFIPSSPTTVAQIASTTDILRISGFSSDIAAAGQLSFNITNLRFRNPPSTKPLTTITAKSFNSLGYNIDSQITGISYQSTTAATMTTKSVQITQTDPIISRQSQYDFTILLPLPLPVGAKCLITIPPQVSIYSTNTYGDAFAVNGNLILNSGLGYSPLYQVLQVASSTSSSSLVTIEVSNLVPDSSYYADDNSYVKFSLLELLNPNSTALTDTFQLAFYDGNYSIMNISSELNMSASPGNLLNIQITPQNYKTREPVPYTFKFTVTHDILSGGHIQVKFPAQVTVVAASLTYQSVQTLNKAAVLSYNSTTHSIYLKNAFTQVYSAPTTVQFIISTGLINPNTDAQTGSFIVSTLAPNNNTVDQDSSISFEPTPNVIESVTVQACVGSLTPSSTSQVCTYQLKFKMGYAYPILLNSNIIIQLPQELSLSGISEDTLDKYSYTEGVNDVSSVFSYISQSSGSSSYTVISIANAFNATTQYTSQYSLESFYVNIANINSPRSTQPTSSFHCTITDQYQNIQYKRESEIVAQVAQASTFQKSAIKRSNEIDGASNSTYLFSLTLSSTCYKNEYIMIVPPGSITILSANNQCKGVVGLASSLACSVSNNNLKILMTPSDSTQTQFNVGQTLQFQVTSIVNPISMEPTASFSIYISTSQQYNYYVNQQTTGLSILNSWANNLTNVAILPDSNALGATTNYVFYFTTTNAVPLNGIIRIYFPYTIYGKALTSGSISCTSIQNLPSSIQCYMGTNGMLTVYNGFNLSALTGGQQIGIKIKNINNPTTGVTSSEQFQLSTVSANGYVVDQTYNLAFTIGCDYPCATCATDKSQCTSCLTLPSQLTPFYLYGSTCGTSCPSGYFPNSTNICQQCTYPCSNCLDSPTNCTSCQPLSSTPYIEQDAGKCYNQCPIGTYLEDSTSSCEHCVSPCKQCTSQTDCLVCSSEYYFWNNQCFKQCPSTSIPIQASQSNQIVAECASCKSPCLTCSGKIDQCTTCQVTPQVYYLYGDQCLSRCPKKYIPDSNNVCVKSDQPVYPFLSFAVTGSIIIIVAISNIIFKRTRFFTALLALESQAIVVLWLYLLAFLIKDKYSSSSGLLVFSLIVNIAINVFWYFYYRKKVLALDQSYQIYKQHYPKTQGIIIILCLVGSFQLFRIQYSRLFNIKALSCTFHLKEKYYKKLNRYSVIQATFVYMPIIGANIYNLNWTWYGRQVFWIDIESIITSILMLVAHMIVILRTENMYAVDKYTVGALTSLDTTPRGDTVMGSEGNTDRLATTEAGEGAKSKGKGAIGYRKDALSKVLDKVKGNKEAAFNLGMTHDNSNLDSLDNTQQMDETNFGKGSKDRYKQYQSETRFNQASSNNFQNKGQQRYNQLMQDTFRDDSVIFSKSQDGGIHGVMNDSQRDYNGDNQGATSMIGGTTGINELDFTTAPINITNLLQADSKLNERYRQFQKQLEKQKQISPQKGQKRSKSPIKDSNPNNIYHTLGRTDTSPKFVKKSPKQQAKSASKNVSTSSYKRVQGESSSSLSGTMGEHYHTHQHHNSHNIKEMGKELKGTKNQQQLDGSENSKRPQPAMINDIKQEIVHVKSINENLKLDNASYVQGNQVLESQLGGEKIQTGELQQSILSLQQQIDLMNQQFLEAQRKRKEELEFLQQANFTSDEEDMGISPSTYDVLNQRFSDINDIKMYISTMDNQSRATLIQGEQMKHLDRQIKSSQEGRSYSKKKSSDLGKIVPITSEQEEQLSGGTLRLDLGAERQIQPSDRTGQLNLHRSPSQMLRDEQGEDEDDSNNGWQLLEDQISGDDRTPYGGNIDESMTSEQFFKLIEAQGTENIHNLKAYQNDPDFAQYAEQFMQALRNDLHADPKNMKRLIDYIDMMDQQKSKLFIKRKKQLSEQSKEKRKKIKKKKRQPTKEEIEKYGPYFNYLPFEKAVIESKGKTPINNYQAEQIITTTNKAKPGDGGATNTSFRRMAERAQNKDTLSVSDYNVNIDKSRLEQPNDKVQEIDMIEDNDLSGFGSQKQ